MRKILKIAILLISLTLFPIWSISGAHASEPWVAMDWDFGNGVYKEAAFSLSNSGSRIQVFTGESLPWNVSGKCSLLDAGLPAGTLVFDFFLVGKDSEGDNIYNGKTLECENTDNVWTFSLGGLWSAVLMGGDNPHSTPPLADGPDNIFNIFQGRIRPGDDVPALNSIGLSRKGESVPTPTAKDIDYEKPKVKALVSTGKRGGLASLRYTSSDDSEEAFEKITIFYGKKAVGGITTEKGERGPNITYIQKWAVKKTFYGKFQFCLIAIDRAGNESNKSCAVLTIKK